MHKTWAHLPINKIIKLDCGFLTIWGCRCNRWANRIAHNITCSSLSNYWSRRRFRIDQGPFAWELILFEALSRRGLNPVKLAYSPSRPDGRLR